MDTTYLDWAATAPPMENIAEEALKQSRSLYANPSSIHLSGAAARNHIEEMRRLCAVSLGAVPDKVYFTSGGSEANNIALLSLLNRPYRGSLVLTGIEHASVYEPAKYLEKKGFDTRFVNAEKDGIIDPERFAAKTDDGTLMAAVMLVNNETGAVQPVAEIAARIREKTGGRPIHIHCDAVQAFGKIAVDVDALGVDSLSVSGHKLGAPRGAGLLYLRKKIEPVFRGGGQEDGLRPGTENLYSITGLAKAADMWRTNRAQWHNHAAGLKELICASVVGIPGARVLDTQYGSLHERYSPFICIFSFPPIPGEVLVRVMSDRGYSISTGSACSSRGQKNTRVLSGMAIDRGFADSAIRVSFGPETTRDQCVSFCEILAKEVGTLSGQIRGR